MPEVAFPVATLSMAGGKTCIDSTTFLDDALFDDLAGVFTLAAACLRALHAAVLPGASLSSLRSLV